ncbi:single-stranded DNA-binding protein [Shewanella aestuarii]|uniref:Single-stranded DNA-binding protein n=1 Tax=Shewanella aestuarii TaxID=1028752 RepID=A0A6G9QP03_9GAMM|nr:single-stranded DNA-binding protein [Shewanella aestuarii]QIR16330.1 single-stranded DNA-binding protein [Shewanella aestuarii]
MNNHNHTQNQSTRQNTIRFTGNVSQVKPLQNGGASISLAYNEGKMVNNEWQQSDTLYMSCIVPAKLNFIPNIGDKMTIEGFLGSDNYQPQGGKKRYGVKIIINQILEYSEKQQAPQQNGYQNRPAPQQNSYQQAPQQNGYQNRPAPQQNSYQQAPQQNGYQNRPAPQQNNQAPQNNFQQGNGFRQNY